MFCALCTHPPLSQWFNSDLGVWLSNILFPFSVALLRLSVLEEADPLGFREEDMHCIHCHFFGVVHSCSYFCHSGLEASKMNFLPAANCQTPPKQPLGMDLPRAGSQHIPQNIQQRNPTWVHQLHNCSQCASDQGSSSSFCSFSGHH